ncbi:MAG: hypothetical protein NVS3B25_20710 [Hymenobacter sp.]
MSTAAAQLPPDEAERLRTLHHYNILTAPPEAVFNHLVALAAHLFGLPLAFISLVDEHEVRYLSLHGSPHLPPLPRADTLCSVAIGRPRTTAYENLPATPQSGPDAPALRAALAHGAGFYAAAPLRMPDGRNIGVLCLVGPQPRPFSPAEQQVLEALADVTSVAIAVRHLCQATPELGPDEWPAVQQRLCHDLHVLRTHLDQLLAQHGTHVPVPPAVLGSLRQRLQSLRVVLAD